MNLKHIRHSLRLRTRPVKPGIRELLDLANKLPRFDRLNDTGWAIHRDVLDLDRYDLDAQRYIVGRAKERLHPELQAFVDPIIEYKDNQLVLDPRLQKAEPSVVSYLLCYQDAIAPLPIRRSINEGDCDQTDSTIHEMRQRYLFLFAVGEILRCVSRFAVSHDIARHDLEQAQRYLVPPDSALSKVDSLRVQLTIDSETGKLALRRPLLFQVLENVEAERIRECPVCQKLYWAGRLDQSTCSPRCSNVWRGRKWRKSYKTKYKQQRNLKAAASKTSKIGKRRKKAEETAKTRTKGK